MNERQLVNCAQCGAPVSQFDLDTPHLYCTNCGAEIVVPTAVEARAVAYGSEMHRETQRADRALRAEVAAVEATATVKKSRYGAWLTWYVGALPVLAIGYGVVRQWFFPDPQHADDMVACYVFLALGFLPIILFIVLALLPSRKNTALAGSKIANQNVSAPCEACGAELVFAPGILSKSCEYCGAANVAPSRVANPMIQWASSQARAAERERDRSYDAEDRAKAQALRRSEYLASFWNAVGPFILPVGFPFLVGISFYKADRGGALVSVALGVIGFIAEERTSLCTTNRLTPPGVEIVHSARGLLSL